MSTAANKAAGYHGMRNVKTVKRVAGKSGTIMIPVSYAKNLSLTPEISETAVFADDRKVLSRTTDNGYTGEAGFTARDNELETAVGTLRPVANGIARTSSRGNARFDTYYEHTESMEDGRDINVKSWLLNHTFGKAAENHSTDEESLSFGAYTYPITVYGDKGLSDESGTTWVDENGMETTVTRIFSVPDDEGYATFGDTVPKPIVLPEA